MSRFAATPPSATIATRAVARGALAAWPGAGSRRGSPGLGGSGRGGSGAGRGWRAGRWCAGRWCAGLALLALLGALAPGAALARAGGGASMGSRGSRSFVAPPATRTAPAAAEPMGRSLAPRTEPAASPAPPLAAAPPYAPAPYGARPAMGGFGAPLGGRSAFSSGLLGGLIGAGLGGMLMGHGLFGGVDGAGGMLGLLLQVGLLLLLGRWLLRRFGGRMPALAGGSFRPGFGARPNPGPAAPAGPRARPGTPPLPVAAGDFQAFEQLLHRVQEAWSARDLAALRDLTTPEMVGYFSEQLSDQASRGQRNAVTAVRLDSGDLSEAWSEGARDYATVAMRYSMLDVTRDAAGAVVDGSPTERVSVVELWTFLRARGGRWVLAAIQQGR